MDQVATTNEQDSSFAAGTVFGPYTLVRQIGRGGMAEVYLARSIAQGFLVAVKVVRQALAQKKHFIEMFVREGNLALRLDHPVIVKTYEVGRVDDRHYISMEYISGVDLLALLRRCRLDHTSRIPIPHALYIAQHIAEGLHYAHELCDEHGRPLNLVNRDVTPSNIRLTFNGEVKLLDFGIAKATSGLTSEIGVLKGKLRYMSPEQVRGFPLDGRSDVFSLGIVLYELLTQEMLFRGESEFQIMDQVRRAELQPPSKNNSRITSQVDAIVLKALQKNAAERYRTAGELAADLHTALQGYHFSAAELQELMQSMYGEDWSREKEFLRGEKQSPPAHLAEATPRCFESSLGEVAVPAQANPRARLPTRAALLVGFTIMLLLSLLACVFLWRT